MITPALKLRPPPEPPKLAFTATVTPAPKFNVPKLLDAVRESCADPPDVATDTASPDATPVSSEM